MYRRVTIALLCAAMALALSGCGGSKNLINWNDAVERENLLAAANSWIRGIEEYDFEAMAGNGIMAAGFELTITENKRSYLKDLATLRTELLADKGYQLAFRDEAGYALHLDIDGGPVVGDAVHGEDAENAWSITEFGQYKASIIGGFEVFERWSGSDVVWRSDSGQIQADFIRSYNAWKLVSMEIKFGEEHYADFCGVGGASVGRAASAGARTLTGFGFGIRP